MKNKRDDKTDKEKKLLGRAVTLNCIAIVLAIFLTASTIFLNILGTRFRDHGICPFFSIEIVHAAVHALTLNFVKAMNNNEYLPVFQETELAMHTKL